MLLVCNADVSGNPYQKKMNFRSLDQGDRWTTDMLQIKETIEDLIALREANRIPYFIYEGILGGWLDGIVGPAVIHWGPGLMPLDIRNAVNTVQGGMGRDLTEFGDDFGASYLGVVSPTYDVTITE